MYSLTDPQIENLFQALCVLHPLGDQLRINKILTVTNKAH